MLSSLRPAAQLFVLVVIQLVPHLVFAQVSVSPSQPTALDTLHVVVPAGVLGWAAVDARPAGQPLNTFNPRATRVSMAANKVTVSVELASDEFGGPASALNMPIGQLPAGAYQVEVVRRLPDGTSAGSAGTAEFSIAPRPEAGPLWNHTDMWWNPAESGWGISLVQHPSGIIFGVWFVYGENGQPTWYVIPTGSWSSATEYRGPIYRTRGPYFGLSAFDPSLTDVILVGTAVIGFSAQDPNRGSASFTIDGQTVVKTIRRQGF